MGTFNAKIAYWNSEEITFSEKTKSGKITIRDKFISFSENHKDKNVLYTQIKECNLKKWAGIGTYIHLKTNNQTINFFLPRINIANWFIVNNYFKTRKCFAIIQENIRNR